MVPNLVPVPAAPICRRAAGSWPVCVASSAGSTKRRRRRCRQKPGSRKRSSPTACCSCPPPPGSRRRCTGRCRRARPHDRDCGRLRHRGRLGLRDGNGLGREYPLDRLAGDRLRERLGRKGDRCRAFQGRLGRNGARQRCRDSVQVRSPPTLRNQRDGGEQPEQPEDRGGGQLRRYAHRLGATAAHWLFPHDPSVQHLHDASASISSGRCRSGCPSPGCYWNSASVRAALSAAARAFAAVLARFVRLSLGGRSPRLELSHLLLEAATFLAAILLRTPRGCQLVAWRRLLPRSQPRQRLEPGRFERLGQPARAKRFPPLGRLRPGGKGLRDALQGGRRRRPARILQQPLGAAARGRAPAAARAAAPPAAPPARPSRRAPASGAPRRSSGARRAACARGARAGSRPRREPTASRASGSPRNPASSPGRSARR